MLKIYGFYVKPSISFLANDTVMLDGFSLCIGPEIKIPAGKILIPSHEHLSSNHSELTESLKRFMELSAKGFYSSPIYDPMEHSHSLKAFAMHAWVKDKFYDTNLQVCTLPVFIQKLLYFAMFSQVQIFPSPKQSAPFSFQPNCIYRDGSFWTTKVLTHGDMICIDGLKTIVPDGGFYPTTFFI